MIQRPGPHTTTQPTTQTMMQTMTALAVCVASAALFAIGCGRPLTTVVLEPLGFAHASAPIDGAIELCLDRDLRMRQWNVRNHPFKIELGSRAALNVERLAKAAFQRVVVSFDEPCGSATANPWLTASLFAANREPDSLWSSSQETTVTMKFALANDDGEPIWSTTTRGSVRKTPAFFARRKTRAAKDFGEAIAIALDAAFEELLTSPEVRQAFARPDASRADDRAP